MKAQRSPVRFEIDELRRRLQETEETLDAIRSGEVDALVVAGPEGERIFTLRGAEHPYRVMVESMNEGAISLALDGTILYCNGAFARMINVALDQVMGHKLEEFVSAGDLPGLDELLTRGRSQAIRAEMRWSLRRASCPRKSPSIRSRWMTTRVRSLASSLPI